jgi:hypothetical protein
MIFETTRRWQGCTATNAENAIGESSANHLVKACFALKRVLCRLIQRFANLARYPFNARPFRMAPFLPPFSPFGLKRFEFVSEHDGLPSIAMFPDDEDPEAPPPSPDGPLSSTAEPGRFTPLPPQEEIDQALEELARLGGDSDAFLRNREAWGKRWNAAGFAVPQCVDERACRATRGSR